MFDAVIEIANPQPLPFWMTSCNASVGVYHNGKTVF